MWAEAGYGFIDRTGELVLRPMFRMPAFFKRGVAGGPKDGYIDRTGHFLGDRGTRER